MQCGVGQFTRLLVRDRSRSSIPAARTTLTLTRTEGSIAEIWRAVGSARNVVCNFPIVAWKRVIFRPLLALAMARLRRRRVILIQHEWAGLHWLRRITYLPGAAACRYHRDVLAAGAARTRRRPLGRLDRAKNACWRRCRRTSKRPPGPPIPSCGSGSPPRAKSGRLVIGHFGSIYPGKQPNALLDIGASPRRSAD